MIKRFACLILLVGLTLVACASNKDSNSLLTLDTTEQATVAFQGEPPVSNLLADPTPTTFVAPDISIRTDNDLYKQGESIVVLIENNSSETIHFMDNCSLNMCFKSGANWICEERECDGPMIVNEPGSHLEILLEAKSIVLSAAADGSYRYKLDYQIVSEKPFYFAHSNEFTIQGAGVSPNLTN